MTWKLAKLNTKAILGDDATEKKFERKKCTAFPRPRENLSSPTIAGESSECAVQFNGFPFFSIFCRVQLCLFVLTNGAPLWMR